MVSELSCFIKDMLREKYAKNIPEDEICWAWRNIKLIIENDRDFT